jgi:hypothetical protein
MTDEEKGGLPRVRDPGNLEEHGVTIPAPTPTAISIPNPWKPSSNGSHSAPAADNGAPPAGKRSD